jgi:hypothetical protein
MIEQKEMACTAFAGMRCVSSGELKSVVRAVKKALDGGESETILIFNNQTSALVEIDFRGTLKETLARLDSTEPAVEPESNRVRGRPKLGVVSREVTLLPRHWDWLKSQPGGASVALRKLVDDARKVHRGRDSVRQAQNVSYGFMHAIAGDLPGFEEASRALFAGDRKGFARHIAQWPKDIAKHLQKLSAGAFG